MLWERRGAPDPMLPLGLFRRSNFTSGNVETALIYGALGLLFFVLVVFLQQTAGYTALEAGAATIPTTVVLLVLAKRFGSLADTYGLRLFVAAGPLVAASGVLFLLAMVDETPAFLLDVLPGITIFALGLAIVVAPLTAAILGDADESTAGIASGVNNAVARVAGLLATAAVGTVAGGALNLGGFRMALAVVAGLVSLGGAIGTGAIRKPQLLVAASQCAGGQLVALRPRSPTCAAPPDVLRRPPAPLGNRRGSYPDAGSPRGREGDDMTTSKPISGSESYEPLSPAEKLEEEAALGGEIAAGGLRAVEVAVVVLAGLLVCPPLAILTFLVVAPLLVVALVLGLIVAVLSTPYLLVHHFHGHDRRHLQLLAHRLQRAGRALNDLAPHRIVADARKATARR
jgi:MFS transporter